MTRDDVVHERCGDHHAHRRLLALDALEAHVQVVRQPVLERAVDDDAIDAMREALPVFGQKIQGFDRADAVMTGVETRTSSPL